MLTQHCKTIYQTYTGHMASQSVLTAQPNDDVLILSILEMLSPILYCKTSIARLPVRDKCGENWSQQRGGLSIEWQYRVKLEKQVLITK